MVGGLTKDQWRDLEDLFQRNEPPPATDREMADAAHITAITLAGSDAGVLFNFEINRTGTRFVYFSAIAALAFARDTSTAGDERGWWNEGLAYQRNIALPFPTGNDAKTADFVASFTTTAAPDGLFVKFVLGKELVTYAIVKNVAMEMMLGTFETGKRFGWLDSSSE